MGECANSLRQRAAAVLRQSFQQEAMSGSDPILELIGLLLAEETGSPPVSAQSGLSLDQWLTWNRLALTQPKILARAITRVARRERLKLPAELPAMRIWAASLVLTTLDWLALR